MDDEPGCHPTGLAHCHYRVQRQFDSLTLKLCVKLKDRGPNTIVCGLRDDLDFLLAYKLLASFHIDHNVLHYKSPAIFGVLNQPGLLPKM